MKRILVTLSLAMFASTNVHANTAIQKIDLKGSFYEMGRQYVASTGELVIDQLALNKQELFPADPEKNKFFSQLVHLWIQKAKTRYPKEIYEFIKGEADSQFALEHGLTLDDFVFLDQSIILTLMSQEVKRGPTSIDSCTFLGLNDPDVIIGRNFDYPRDNIHMGTSHPLIVTLKSDDQIHYPYKVMTITNPGMISSATFMNDHGYFIAINAGSSVGNQYKVFQRQSYFNQMLLQMFKTNRFDSLEQWVMTTAPDFGYLVNIAGPEKVVSVEASPYNELQGHFPTDQIPDNVFKTRARSAIENQTVEPEVDSNPDFIVAANTFRLLDWAVILGHEHTQQTPSFSYERYHNLVNVVRQRQSSTAKDTLIIMEKELNTNASLPGATVHYCSVDPYYQNDLSSTYYTVVFDTRKKNVAVRFQQTDSSSQAIPCASQWTPWQSFDF